MVHDQKRRDMPSAVVTILSAGGVVLVLTIAIIVTVMREAAGGMLKNPDLFYALSAGILVSLFIFILALLLGRSDVKTIVDKINEMDVAMKNMAESMKRLAGAQVQTAAKLCSIESILLRIEERLKPGS